MQEAFLAAVNKSRQRQLIKGCSVCGQQGHTEQSLLLVETEPHQCAAADKRAPSIQAAQPAARYQPQRRPWGAQSQTDTFKNQPTKSCFAFHQRVCYKHIKSLTAGYLTTSKKPNIKVIPKPSFCALSYSQPLRAILLLVQRSWEIFYNDYTLQLR